MKAFNALTIAIAIGVSILVISTIASAQTSPTNIVKYNGEALSTPVVLPTNAVAVIELEENITTGHTWKTLPNSNLTVLGSRHEIVYPGVLGAPGVRKIYVAGKRAGAYQLSLIHGRSFENSVNKTKVITFLSKGAFTGSFTLPAEDIFIPEVHIKPKFVPTRQLPDHLNWCDEENGGCTPVKNQGGCGSCWAFGTLGPLELLVKIKDGETHPLAEQFLVSCTIWGSAAAVERLSINI